MKRPSGGAVPSPGEPVAVIGDPGQDPTTRNVVSLGWVAFFGGMAQDMIQPILPLFYVSVLGLSKEFIGLIEGALTTVASLMRIASGYLSDALGARKPLLFLGYGLSAIGRFALGFAGSGTAVLGLRAADGAGKGIKDAPRDALVAASAGTRSLGRAFGIQRTLDTLGSVAGPLVTFLLLRLWATHPNRLREVFWVAGVVAAVPLVIIVVAVRERAVRAAKQSLNVRDAGRTFLWFLAVMLLFSLGNSSDAFLILRAQGLGVGIATIPIVYALFNLTSAVIAIPAGQLSDRIGRRRVIALGWLVYAFVYLGFALAARTWLVWVLYAAYGLFYALTEGAAKAMVAEIVPEAVRGRAYGLYNASIGIIALPASLIAGILWDRISPAAPFYFGAILALLAVIGLWIIPHRPSAPAAA